ncbi:forkhead box protein J2-like [Ceratitis capitata]|uniref:forkhead box protein J2-like n=1 Tax=Ceratitis capitata TaxID=7213 RepID=UPI000329C643|nr:forkhead box protein J2-like [Ceratitis capitata]
MVLGETFHIRALLADTGVFKDDTPPQPPPPRQLISNAVNYLNKNSQITYSEAIVLAIRSSVDNRLPLQKIYSWIEKEFPEFRHRNENWRDNIRHTLSINKIFTLVPRPADDPGRGKYWTIDTTQEKKAKRNRRQNQVPKTSTPATTIRNTTPAIALSPWQPGFNMYFPLTVNPFIFPFDLMPVCPPPYLFYNLPETIRSP